MNEFDEAISLLESWAQVDRERNFRIEHEYSRNHWESEGVPDQAHRYSCETWDPKNGSGGGFGASAVDAARQAIEQVPKT